jgi:(p)ppGpp synthase/HD superfamily hydrolase
MPEDSADARELARRAHRGQQDKAGRDYFEGHLVPIASAAKLFGPDAVAAAWLHDVLEDTDVTIEDLARVGVPPRSRPGWRTPERHCRRGVGDP